MAPGEIGVMGNEQIEKGAIHLVNESMQVNRKSLRTILNEITKMAKRRLLLSFNDFVQYQLGIIHPLFAYAASTMLLPAVFTSEQKGNQ